ncbi:hypothetical protein GCM10009733_108800 [Nonomuraea maheshkhaliensis]|uniref:2Fe-2S ferredoxin-type domain-containing protein n=1 Tax=Nonomuraea maheshkhaliensis TaxID=419590 RepID=A0ABN2HY13_9ACTN
MIEATACFAAQAGRHLRAIERVLGVAADQERDGSEVSLQTVRRLGYCYGGPAALDGETACAGPDVAAKRASAGGSPETVVIANGDEGDPGSYADRLLMEADPDRILEGPALACFACGARRGVVLVRSEYPRALASMREAAERVRADGHLGRRVHGSDVDLDVEVLRRLLALPGRLSPGAGTGQSRGSSRRRLRGHAERDEQGRPVRVRPPAAARRPRPRPRLWRSSDGMGRMRATVDGVPVTLPEDATLLTALRAAGADVPALCHDERLTPVGSCRTCLVRAGGRDLAACVTPAEEGAEIQVHQDDLPGLRRDAVGLIVSVLPPYALEGDGELARTCRELGIGPADDQRGAGRGRDQRGAGRGRDRSFPSSRVNALTSGHADTVTSCPEYKVTAVRLRQEESQ